MYFIGIKTQVGVKIDEDNLKILDDLPSSAVEMQVKSKVSTVRTEPRQGISKDDS